MSDAIRCGQCRWWREICFYGACEHSPPVFTPDYMGRDWQQPMTQFDQGCSRGERKTEASNLTVSDGDPVAMVDGLPVFRATLTEDAT